MCFLSSNKRRISLPVHQCVLSVPKRLRYFMQRDSALLSMFLHGVELNLRAMVDINCLDHLADLIVKAVLR